MRPSHALVITFFAAGLAISAQAPDRTMPPRSGPPPLLKLPAIQKRQLGNGLPVWIVELHKVPVAQVNLVVFGGATDDPSGKFGVTSLMTAMLEEGELRSLASLARELRMAALIEACWKSVATVCGLKIDPSNIAT